MNELFTIVNEIAHSTGTFATALMPDFISNIIGDILTSVAPYWNEIIILLFENSF